MDELPFALWLGMISTVRMESMGLWGRLSLSLWLISSQYSPLPSISGAWIQTGRKWPPSLTGRLKKVWTSVSQTAQLLSRVRLFETPWIAACQASLSITNSQSSLRLTDIESVMPSSHLILCRPLLLLSYNLWNLIFLKWRNLDFEFLCASRSSTDAREGRVWTAAVHSSRTLDFT